MPNDGGALLLSYSEARSAIALHGVDKCSVRRLVGTKELTNAIPRCCIWIGRAEPVPSNEWLGERFRRVERARDASPRKSTKKLSKIPHLFGEIRQRGDETIIIISGASSENREYLPVDFRAPGTIVSNLAFGIFASELWNLALIASRLHLVWIATVCGKLKTDFRYSNTLGWNTFPVPALTNSNKSDLTRCAENILLARENHFPATIAELYDPENMPDDLRRAHEENDETLERIYIGRRFKNDTERLEKLFDMYSKMIEAEKAATPAKTKAKKPKAVS